MNKDVHVPRIVRSRKGEKPTVIKIRATNTSSEPYVTTIGKVFAIVLVAFLFGLFTGLFTGLIFRGSPFFLQ